jgi:hypothetical protein
MYLEKFVRHFGFRVVRINEGGYKQIDSWSAYNSPSYYRDTDATTIEMEIDRRRLEHMANYFEQSQRLDDQDRDEEFLRRQYPPLKEAYDKYKLLLALYK